MNDLKFEVRELYLNAAATCLWNKLMKFAFCSCSYYMCDAFYCSTPGSITARLCNSWFTGFRLDYMIRGAFPLIGETILSPCILFPCKCCSWLNYHRIDNRHFVTALILNNSLTITALNKPNQDEPTWNEIIPLTKANKKLSWWRQTRATHLMVRQGHVTWGVSPPAGCYRLQTLSLSRQQGLCRPCF